MKYTLYLKQENQDIVKKENLTMRQIAFLFDNLEKANIKFKYNIVRGSQATVLNVKKVSHHLLDSKNLIFKLV